MAGHLTLDQRMLVRAQPPHPPNLIIVTKDFLSHTELTKFFIEMTENYPSFYVERWNAYDIKIDFQLDKNDYVLWKMGE